jgi:hypothetical protein
MTILFLDFDGVLHPYSPWPHDDAVRSQYFIHLPRLESVLRDFAKVQVVIASDWRLYHPLEKLRTFFSEDIRPRVSGTTVSRRTISQYENSVDARSTTLGSLFSDTRTRSRSPLLRIDC